MARLSTSLITGPGGDRADLHAGGGRGTLGEISSRYSQVGNRKRKGKYKRAMNKVFERYRPAKTNLFTRCN